MKSSQREDETVTVRQMILYKSEKIRCEYLIVLKIHSIRLKKKNNMLEKVLLYSFECFRLCYNRGCSIYSFYNTVLTVNMLTL